MRYYIYMYHSVLLPLAGTYLTLKPKYTIVGARKNEIGDDLWSLQIALNVRWTGKRKTERPAGR